MENLKYLIQVQFKNDWWILLLPTCLMALDILSGVTHAWATGHLKSYRMREGLERKCAELLAIITAETINVALYVPSYVMVGVSAYIIFMELVSLLENLEKMKFPLPHFVRRALGVAKEVISGDELSEDAKKDIKKAKEALDKKKEG